MRPCGGENHARSFPVDGPLPPEIVEAEKDAVAECGDGVAVQEAVDAEAAFFAADETGLPEQSEVMGDGRLLDGQLFLEIADADGTGTACEDLQDLKPDRVRDGLEVAGQHSDFLEVAGGGWSGPGRLFPSDERARHTVSR